MAASSADQKKVRFNLDADIESLSGTDNSSQWEFIKYSLLMRDDFSLNALVDSLVQRGIISADAGTEVGRQAKIKSKLEYCVQEVIKAGPDGYYNFCEILTELGYGSLVDAVHGDVASLSSQASDSDLDDILPTSSSASRYRDQQQWVQTGSASSSQGGEMSITGKKMSISSLSKETKSSQREFSVIMERQADLEKQLVQVMKSLDSAKDLLIRERQEKLSLRDQLKSKDDELVDMQKKYLELQKSMGTLRETNNKYHEKVTKLQIENDQLRKGVKDKTNLQLELNEKNRELTRMKETLNRQEKQISNQEQLIVQKLSMIENVVTEHKTILEGQDRLQQKVVSQSEALTRLSEDKAESQNQLIAQQRQLNFQQAQIVMLQEHMQRIETHFTGSANTSPGSTLSESSSNNSPQATVDNRGKRYINTLSRSVNGRPFNVSGKLESSKNTYWKEDVQAAKKFK